MILSMEAIQVVERRASLRYQGGTQSLDLVSGECAESNDNADDRVGTPNYPKMLEFFMGLP